MRSRGRMLGLISGRTQPNGRVRLGLPPRALNGGVQPTMVGGPPSHCAIKERWGPQGARTPKFAVLPKTHRQNPNRSRGCAASDGKNATGIPGVICTAAHAIVASASLSLPLVAAFERISIAEPEMAGSTSSSSAGGEGPLYPISLCICCRSRTLVLRTKKRERIPLDLCTLLILFC